MLSFIKENFLPGSLRLLVYGLLLGIALMRAPGIWGRLGRRCLVTVALMYSLLTLPVVSLLLAAPLHRGWTPITARDAAGATAVVVLGGGVETHHGSGQVFERPGELTLRRLLEGVRVYRLLDSPAVITSGGVVAENQRQPEGMVMQDLLVRMGLPRDRIVVEGMSRNTREQALRVREVLQSLGASRFVLVTSPVHMYRAVRVFRAAGLAPLTSSSACCDWEARPGGAWMALPSNSALELSYSALYEYLGLTYYWLRDWI